MTVSRARLRFFSSTIGLTDQRLTGRTRDGLTGHRSSNERTPKRATKRARSQLSDAARPPQHFPRVDSGADASTDAAAAGGNCACAAGEPVSAENEIRGVETVAGRSVLSGTSCGGGAAAAAGWRPRVAVETAG